MTGLELLRGARVPEQPGGAADVELRPAVGEQLDERRPDPLQENTLAGRQLGIVELSSQRAGSEPGARNALVEELLGPARQPAVDRVLRLEEPLRDAPRRRDHHHHHDARLQDEHLDVSHHCRLERRRRDEREETSRLREHLRGRLQCRVELVPHRREVEREAPRPPLDRSHELLRVDAVAALRRDAPRRGVRMGEQAEPLELGELDPDGRRGGVDAGAHDERPRRRAGGSPACEG